MLETCRILLVRSDQVFLDWGGHHVVYTYHVLWPVDIWLFINIFQSAGTVVQYPKFSSRTPSKIEPITSSTWWRSEKRMACSISPSAPLSWMKCSLFRALRKGATDYHDYYLWEGQSRAHLMARAGLLIYLTLRLPSPDHTVEEK